MSLDGLFAQTQVTFDPHLACDELIECDQLTLNGRFETGPALKRVSLFLEQVRQMAGITLPARVISENNFPIGAGIASSAAAFAALALAATRAAGLRLPEADLSRLARRGSGSACRSVPGGFVEWQASSSEEESYAFSIAPAEHWHLMDCVAILEVGHKPVGSTEGHGIADSSRLQTARVKDTPRRMDICRRAILTRDFAALADMIEEDSNLMHAVMMTSYPPLFYWEPTSLALMKAVKAWRQEGLPAAYTLDAGPNVHIICEASAADDVKRRLEDMPGVQRVLTANPGGPARLIEEAGSDARRGNP